MLGASYGQSKERRVVIVVLTLKRQRQRHNSPQRKVNGFEPRTTSDTEQESEEQDVRIRCYDASCTARGLFLFPVGPLVATAMMSCICPSSSASFFPSIFAVGPAPRRRFRAPGCTLSIRVPSSLRSLARSCSDRPSYESEFRAAPTGPDEFTDKIGCGSSALWPFCCCNTDGNCREEGL